MSEKSTIAPPMPLDTQGLTVTIGAPPADIEAQWGELVRQGGNAFMHPAALKAAAETTGTQIVTLYASAAERLVGFWSLRIKRPLPFLPEQLEALPYEYAFLSTPIVDLPHGAMVMAAFLAAIARDTRLPKALWLKDFDQEGPAFAGLAGLPQQPVKTQSRPVVTRDFGVKHSGSTRKKLRQDWNRLCAIGPVEIRNEREREAALAGLETFFALEAAGWKGERGTALANREDDTRFARRMIGDMAAKGDASVGQLMVGSQVIAAQVLLYCGTTAYTWKIAYDTKWARFSPGALLVDKLTESLLAGDIERIDSCALDTGFMGRLWEGRKQTIDLVVSAQQRPGLGFRIAAHYRQFYERLRRQRDLWRERRAKAGKQS